MEIIGGKWKSSIVCLLFDGRARRYSEIRHVMPEVTNAMLAQSLKELERDHIVNSLCGKCAFTSAGTADEGVKQDEHGE